MSLTKREKMALRFARQIYREIARNIRRSGTILAAANIVPPGADEVSRMALELTRMALERADSFLKAMETTPEWMIRAHLEEEKSEAVQKKRGAFGIPGLSPFCLACGASWQTAGLFEDRIQCIRCGAEVPFDPRSVSGD